MAEDILQEDNANPAEEVKCTGGIPLPVIGAGNNGE